MGNGVLRAAWIAAVCVAGSSGLAAAQPAAPVHPDLNGVWAMKFREYIYLDDGKLPPMKPDALAQYNVRVAKLKAGEQIPDSATACLPHGTPRIMYTPYPMQILQQPNVVAFLFEVNHNIRLAYIDEKLPSDPDPTYMGSSVAHWEGPVLVVETIGLNDKIQIDRAGLPQSEATRVTERFTISANGKALQDKITINDPTLYTADWSFTASYNKADYKLMEYVCENNRAVIQK